MFWFALAAMAMSAQQAGKAANGANEANSLQYIQNLKSVSAENKAIAEANAANVIRTGYRVGIQNLQTARMKQQAIEQGYDVSRQGVELLGNNLANAAASGSIGNSVDATVDLIKKKQDEALIDVDSAYEENLLNSNLALEQIIMQGKDALQTARDVDSTTPKRINAIGSALMAGASTFASMYASGKMSLGTQTASRIVDVDAYRSTTMPPLQAIGSPQLNYGLTTADILKG